MSRLDSLALDFFLCFLNTEHSKCLVSGSAALITSCSQQLYSSGGSWGMPLGIAVARPRAVRPGWSGCSAQLSHQLWLPAFFSVCAFPLSPKGSLIETWTDATF